MNTLANRLRFFPLQQLHTAFNSEHTAISDFLSLDCLSLGSHRSERFHSVQADIIFTTKRPISLNRPPFKAHKA